MTGDVEIVVYPSELRRYDVQHFGINRQPTRQAWVWELWSAGVFVAQGATDKGEEQAHRDARTNAEALGFFDHLAA